MRETIERALTARAAAIEPHPVLRQQAGRLERLLAGLRTGSVYLPEAKALLTRDGGVCPDDGSRLAFHPFEPHQHRCDRCGSVQTGERHHRAWVTRYHVWLSERAVHLAVLGALLGRRELSQRAAEILQAYAARYRAYPNADNVLGPTRLFFSTYLEAIWLIQLCVAAILLQVHHESVLSPGAWTEVRSMVGESAGLIGSFDEGWSNRQVWNATALVGAGGFLTNRRMVDAGADGPSGLGSLLRAVGPDGHWHEGENYHLFALRGFLLGAELLRWMGQDAYAGTRLGAMYGAPLATLLPDLTLPARGDAPFGVSVRQPRFAELWELGRARTADRRLDGILARLYAPDATEREDAGLTELAEQEQNRPAHRQHRARLGWKALLWMNPEPPRPGADWSRSCLLEERGIAVLRDGERTVSVECGGRGGGHGHPDRLHLSCYWNGHVFADLGTGSYVQPSLHWYRSALAHNAPALAGSGQHPGRIRCDAFAEAGEWRWCRVVADGIAGAGSAVSRSVLLGPEMLLDVVTVHAPPETMVDLPVHPLAGVTTAVTPADQAIAPAADAGHETGYDRVALVGRAAPRRGALVIDLGELALRLEPRAEETVLLARAPGPPTPDFADGAPLTFLVRRAAGAGRWIQWLVPGGRACQVREDSASLLVEVGPRRLRIAEDDDELTIREGDRSVRLPARRMPPPAAPERPPAPIVVRVPLVAVAPTLDAWPTGGAGFTLGASAYRRSETPHGAAGPFAARLEIVAQGASLWFSFDVSKRDVVVRGAHDADPALDNEPADIHSDGVQCYIGRPAWAGYLVVPELETGGVRVRPVAGTAAGRDRVAGASRRTTGGYRVLVGCAAGGPLRPGDRVAFTAVVNEMRPGRARRAGQLALAGGGWVYLRGDREEAASALVAEIA